MAPRPCSPTKAMPCCWNARPARDRWRGWPLTAATTRPPASCARRRHGCMRRARNRYRTCSGWSPGSSNCGRPRPSTAACSPNRPVRHGRCWTTRATLCRCTATCTTTTCSISANAAGWRSIRSACAASAASTTRTFSATRKTASIWRRSASVGVSRSSWTRRDRAAAPAAMDPGLVRPVRGVVAGRRQRGADRSADRRAGPGRTSALVGLSLLRRFLLS